MMRLVRSAMLDVLDSEFVKLARVKGAGRMEGGLEVLFAQCGHYRSPTLRLAMGLPARW